MLVKMDEELVSLIKIISDKDYQELCKESQKITTTIQKGKDLLSGLGPTEYDIYRKAPMPDSDKNDNNGMLKLASTFSDWYLARMTGIKAQNAYNSHICPK